MSFCGGNRVFRPTNYLGHTELEHWFHAFHSTGEVRDQSHDPWDTKRIAVPLPQGLSYVSVVKLEIVLSLFCFDRSV